MVMETTPEPSSLDAPSHRHNQDKENIGNRTPVTVSTSAIASSSLMGHPNKAPEGGDIVVADADAEMVDALSAQADAATTTTTIAPTPTTKGHQEPHVFSPELLKMYYARLFPYSFLHTWLSYDGTANSHNGSSNGSSNGNGNGTNNMASQTFTRREFSFTLEPVPGEEIYIRYQSFHNEHDLRAAIMRRQPRKIDLGAVFSHPPKDKNAHPSDGNGAFRPVQRELVFDIDLTDYDDVRNCGCSGAKICPVCWTFMQMACRVMHDGLRDDFGFRHVAWFYSGRRGIHAWVCDEEARMLSNEARSAVASYFEVSLSKKKSEGLTYPLHPMLARAYGVLEPYFCRYVLPDDGGHGLMATRESWEDLLDRRLPKSARPTVGANLKKKWAQAPYATSPEEKWHELLRHLKVKFDLPSSPIFDGGDGGGYGNDDDDSTNDNDRAAANKRLKKSNAILDEEKQRIALWPAELVFEYTYPRLDINVSKMQNHLLKSPFCVHPKTGRVCVPIQPDKIDDFDPFTVPTLPQLAKELDDAHHAAAEGRPRDGDRTDDEPQPLDWQRTSLREYFEGFQKGFLEPLQKDLRRKQRDRAEAEAAARGDF